MRESHLGLEKYLVPCQASFFGVGMNDSQLVGRLRSVSQPAFHELAQHECYVNSPRMGLNKRQVATMARVMSNGSHC